jgi:hypothetical protein
VRRLSILRNPAAFALLLCLALGAGVQGAWSARDLDSPQNSERWQPARDHAAMAPATRVPHVRAAHLHRSPVFSLKVSGVPIAAPRQVSGPYAHCSLSVPPSRVVLPRSGRSPPRSL